MNNPYEMLSRMNSIRSQMETLKAELRNLVATGSAGAGMVELSINGEYRVTKLEISDELYAMNDRKMLEVLIAGAFNDATEKLKELIEEKSRSLMANELGMNI